MISKIEDLFKSVLFEYNQEEHVDNLDRAEFDNFFKTYKKSFKMLSKIEVESDNFFKHLHGILSKIHAESDYLSDFMKSLLLTAIFSVIISEKGIASNKTKLSILLLMYEVVKGLIISTSLLKKMQELKDVQYPFPGYIEIELLELQRILDFGFDPYEDSIKEDMKEIIGKISYE
jgi:hypothetical protein